MSGESVSCFVEFGLKFKIVITKALIQAVVVDIIICQIKFIIVNLDQIYFNSESIF